MPWKVVTTNISDNFYYLKIFIKKRRPVIYFFPPQNCIAETKQINLRLSRGRLTKFSEKTKKVQKRREPWD